MKKGLLLFNFDFQGLIYSNLKTIFVNDINQEDNRIHRNRNDSLVKLCFNYLNNSNKFLTLKITTLEFLSTQFFLTLRVRIMFRLMFRPRFRKFSMEHF